MLRRLSALGWLIRARHKGGQGSSIVVIYAASPLANGSRRPACRWPRVGVGDRRGDRRHAGLADAGRRSRRRHDVHLDLRHLVDAQRRGSRRSCAAATRPSFERDLAVADARRRPKPMPPSICAATTSGLIAMPQSTAQTTRSTLTRPSCDRDLGDLRDDGAERLVHGDAARAPWPGERRAPAGLLGRELEHAQVARVLSPAARAGTRAGPCPRRAPARR